MQSPNLRSSVPSPTTFYLVFQTDTNMERKFPKDCSQFVVHRVSSALDKNNLGWVIRFIDDKRQVKLSVHDVIDAGHTVGDLYLTVAWTANTRMRLGTGIHTQKAHVLKRIPIFKKSPFVILW